MKGTLKQWRRFNNMTQTELADAIDRSQVTVANWEKGASQPNASDIAKIEAALNIDWSNDVILMP